LVIRVAAAHHEFIDELILGSLSTEPSWPNNRSPTWVLVFSLTALFVSEMWWERAGQAATRR